MGLTELAEDLPTRSKHAGLSKLQTTLINSLTAIWHELKPKLCRALSAAAFGMCEHNMEMDEAGEEKAKS